MDFAGPSWAQERLALPLRSPSLFYCVSITRCNFRVFSLAYLDQRLVSWGTRTFPLPTWFVVFKLHQACFCFHMMPVPLISDWWVQLAPVHSPCPHVKLTNGQLHFSTPLLWLCSVVLSLTVGSVLLRQTLDLCLLPD